MFEDRGGYKIKGLKLFDTNDGYAFSASVYLNGKKVGSVQNSGHGGPNSYDPVIPKGMKPEAYRKANDAFIKGLQAQALKIDPTATFETEDLLIGALVDDFENEKRFKRLCKTKVLFRLKGDDKGEYRTISVKFSNEVKAKVLDQYKKQGKEIIEFLNEKLVG